MFRQIDDRHTNANPYAVIFTPNRSTFRVSFRHGFPMKTGRATFPRSHFSGTIVQISRFSQFRQLVGLVSWTSFPPLTALRPPFEVRYFHTCMDHRKMAGGVAQTASAEGKINILKTKAK